MNIEMITSNINDFLEEIPNIRTIILLPKLVKGLVPTHIVSDNLYYITDNKYEYILKIGPVKAIEAEYAKLHEISNIIKKEQKLKRISTPSPIKVIGPINNSSALLTSFNGFMTIEKLLTANNIDTILELCSKILYELISLNIVWPNAAPKNIISDNNILHKAQLCICDWENGFIGGDYKDYNFYIRAIQLQEEWIEIKSGIMPYWSMNWPNITELQSNSQPQGLNDTIELKKINSRRIIKLAELLHLDSNLPDSSLFRIVQILGSLSRDENNIYNNSIIYAADHISEHNGTDIRVISSILCWLCELFNRQDLSAKIKKNIFILGKRIAENLLQRENVNKSKEYKLKKNIFRKMENSINNIGSELFLCNEWQEKAFDMCRANIVYAKYVNIRKYRILCYL